MRRENIQAEGSISFQTSPSKIAAWFLEHLTSLPTSERYYAAEKLGQPNLMPEVKTLLSQAEAEGGVLRGTEASTSGLSSTDSKQPRLL